MYDARRYGVFVDEVAGQAYLPPPVSRLLKGCPQVIVRYQNHLVARKKKWTNYTQRYMIANHYIKSEDLIQRALKAA